MTCIAPMPALEMKRKSSTASVTGNRLHPYCKLKCVRSQVKTSQQTAALDNSFESSNNAYPNIEISGEDVENNEVKNNPDKLSEASSLLRKLPSLPSLDHISSGRNIGVLSACSHAGLVDKGIDFFYSMHQDFQVTARPEHYTCMIDLLGRAGRLEDAQTLMKEMPFDPDATMWGALLGASRIHGNTILGEKAAERIFEMEPNNSGMYILLSNLYATSGKWADVGKMRVMMRDKGVGKVPGFSWIEVKNKVHTFALGDSVHPEKEKIYAFLEELDLKMQKAGYVSATEMVLHDVEEEEKIQMLKYHSERLAVAYGILNVPSGRPIRVIKNLRVCKDCHNAIKYMSAIEDRLIILRDSNRFHHFSGGMCSCEDYW